jgi:hypothetical protein
VNHEIEKQFSFLWSGPHLRATLSQNKLVSSDKIEELDYNPPRFGQLSHHYSTGVPT